MRRLRAPPSRICRRAPRQIQAPQRLPHRPGNAKGRPEGAQGPTAARVRLRPRLRLTSFPPWRISSEPPRRHCKHLSSSSSPRTLVDVLCRHASERPSTVSYTFIADNGSELVVDYATLDRRARAIAAHLQGEGAEGGRVVLLLPPGFEFVAGFLGCLYAGATAVPRSRRGPGRTSSGSTGSCATQASPRR